ncbi:Probable ribonuclease ZC3H12B [Eumeta japonica]|uniref:Probable ribonuclease ZC3H12B n=1 Tax=Eumeta variegata TaxID=151549 RepID=A0A4C1UWA6_EUMVA|nr:Probable ribonuclease ZC3H12B [Eumeta japonica]
MNARFCEYGRMLIPGRVAKLEVPSLTDKNSNRRLTKPPYHKVAAPASRVARYDARASRFERRLILNRVRSPMTYCNPKIIHLDFCTGAGGARAAGRLRVAAKAFIACNHVVRSILFSTGKSLHQFAASLDLFYFSRKLLERKHPTSKLSFGFGIVPKYVESSLGWAGERGEDSSYDSECEDEGAHRTASRTPSDTLAAEFAEYVTVASPHQSPMPAPAPPQHYAPLNQAKIEFALKLGYSELVARTALQRLGPDPPQNELLAELIKLGASQPPRTPSPQPALVAPSPHDLYERTRLKHIVIDGSNVAMSHGNKEVFSCKGIEICVDWFRARGHKEITVFVPKWRKEASRPDNPVSDRDVLDRLERERVLVYTPSRLVGGKRLVCYDDRYVLRLAADTDGIVVSNDNYRDLAAESPAFRRVVEERILMYSFVNDRFMPPDDPLGRAGPTLDAFLRAPPARTDPPPACPYGRKCTYGHKCKFHHPERAGRPHKSVAERLSERAARVLRARGDLHTLSLPPGGRQPDAKRPLARAQSATPRLHDAALASHFDRAQLQVAGPSQAIASPQTQPPHPILDNNPHRKLARQLTLNPTCDPRLGTASMHAAAARVVSAPVGAMPTPAPPTSLGACSSESALQQWEARQRMRYHLAGIFPEAQVAEAMAAFPDETNAQTMCALILARIRPNEAPLPPLLPPQPHARPPAPSLR